MNKLFDFALRSRLLILTLAILMLAAGYKSYRELPVDAFPDVSPNLVQIFTITEGLAPEEIEMYVTYPVEAAMTGLPDIEKIRSVSNFGLSVVNVYFSDDVDIYFARQLVNERLQDARNQIPASFGNPQMGPISTGMGLVLFYYLKDSNHLYSLEELRTLQDWVVKFNLQTVPGVTEVLGIGGFQKQFQIIVKPDALLRYKVSLQQLIARVRANNLNVGAQYLEKNSEQFIIRSLGLATNIDDLRQIIVKTVDGRPIYLSELADIKTGGAIRRGLQTYNGKGEVVAGMVIKLFGANASTVIARVEDKIADINKTLPGGVEIVPYYQQKDIVSAAVSTVNNALIQGIILVALVLFVFMGGFRPSLVVALAIPFSVMFAFIAMRYLGMSANLMSLGGLAIAIGMMVDGTIVMVENVDRLMHQSSDDEPRLHIVARACREVGQPILFAIAIIIIVFLPLFTLEGVEGKTFRPLAYTVALAMLGSLIYALLLAPVLSDLLMRKKPKRDQKDFDERILAALLKPYRPVLHYFVNHRKFAIATAVGLLFVGVLIFPFLGSEFTPKLQEGTIVVRLTMAPSIAISESKRNTLIVERKLLKIPEVTGVTSRIGRGEVGAHADPINSAEMYVLLKPKSEWRDPGNQALIEHDIRQAVAELPGIQANLTQPIEMTVDELLEGVRAELAIKLFGEDLALLKQKADEISALIQQVPGAADVQVDQVSGTPQLVIKPDRQAIARYGLNLQDVQEIIRSAIGGVSAGQVFEGIRRFDILVRYREQDRNTVEAIRNLLITGPNNIQIPLAQIASIEEIVGPRQITRENNQRFITIQANVIDRDIVSFVEQAQQNIDDAIQLPPGYFTTWGGQYRLQQEANKRLAFVIPVTLLIITLLLYSSFGSLKNAALILLNIPLALVGGVIALWITGQNLSVPASVGFIALFGIALENGMVLVTYLNQLVKEGLTVDIASIKAACLRLRPVLMTAVTTALGLIPLLLASGTGSEVQKPLATVVVGGLITSTLLTLLVIPALYKWFIPEHLLTPDNDIEKLHHSSGE
ncbi:efflux RND transporter permease subunit [methane-oxidizing endosymbiont of Gigantopelta aegis]|uniref:efflux RND transporter permease subunit n=1 Tax=methane-oxidizing endosymbiont of Gigantopelta aegis TaxID=2794938 RepID=UPI0018DCD007|nr:CusA/CzcA family heavy metal efflux RND transporter [methane-oxidizing endosymbiont of Gigantopelta aegis]